MKLLQLLQKYRKLTSDLHIKWMCDEIKIMHENKTELKDSFKINRWLGFIQGFLYSRSMITIDELREETRGIDDELV